MRRRRLVLCILIFIVFLWILSELNTGYSDKTSYWREFIALPHEIPLHGHSNSEPGELLLGQTYRVTNQKTKPDSKLRVIYNRVPKCGSRSVLTLFKTLALRNKFQVIGSNKNYPYALHQDEQKKITSKIRLWQPPFLYHRHFHYTDFRRLEGPPVVFINLVRDPVSRAVSHFYFRRHGDGISGKPRGKQEPNKNETYDECVLKQHNECTGNWGRFFIVPFFCGHIRDCRNPTRWALERAKQNVVKNYLVVGVLEQMDDFVKVLEVLLPRFFKGAYKEWKTPNNNPKAVISKTRNKRLPSDYVLKIAKTRMALEYEFYDFVKTHFDTLKKELGI